MANYDTIQRLRPSFADYKIQRQLIHRGDTLSFPANVRSDFYSTDPQGFRHSSLAGETLAVADIVRSDRYGIVLGGSKVFGVGLEGNERTIPSLLSERCGFAFANVALPQPASRNLSSMLFAYLIRAPKPPAAVVLLNAGDLTGFCYSSMADPVFGSPNPKILPMVTAERGGLPLPERSLPAMLAFTSLWTRSIAYLCRSQGIPLLLLDDPTFFEKTEPSANDVACQLGVALHPIEQRWHTAHKAFAGQFYDRRKALATQLGVPLIAPAQPDTLSYIDEFHYDEEGCRMLADDLAMALDPLI